MNHNIVAMISFVVIFVTMFIIGISITQAAVLTVVTALSHIAYAEAFHRLKLKK